MIRAAVAAALCAAVSVSLPGGPAAAQTAPDLVARDKLRVCSDPSLLPYSNERGEGFENRIAGLLGRALGVPVAYTWYPQSSGFLRNTLLAQRCDVVMGLNSGGGDAATTATYYHTAYMIVTRAADRVTATALGDPTLAGLRFGVIAGTPPSDLLVAHDLMGQTTAYPLVVDTRHDSPALDMMRDVASGRIDAGLVWGPFAGWAIAHDHLQLHADFLHAEPGHPRLDYTIALGVRPSDTDWARRLAATMQAHRGEVQDILTQAGVPLLDAQGHTLSLPTPMPAPGNAAVAEPIGYRLEDYRAPTPDTVAGGRVVDTEAVRALQQAGQAVLIDVLPAPRQPPGQKPGTLWSPLREDIPGSVWLPGTGQGVLTPAQEDWFRARLTDLAGGDRDRTLVFYCLEQCWMSWNAAKRAAGFGFRHVLWYRGGTDSWARAGLQLARAAPELPPS